MPQSKVHPQEQEPDAPAAVKEVREHDVLFLPKVLAARRRHRQGENEQRHSSRADDCRFSRIQSDQSRLLFAPLLESGLAAAALV